jgi:hypothetical protein
LFAAEDVRATPVGNFLFRDEQEGNLLAALDGALIAPAIDRAKTPDAKNATNFFMNPP